MTEEGPAFFRCPYTIPESFAVVCRNPEDNMYYCQVEGCHRVLKSATSAKRHVAQAHGDHPKSQVSVSSRVDGG